MADLTLPKVPGQIRILPVGGDGTDSLAALLRDLAAFDLKHPPGETATWAKAFVHNDPVAKAPPGWPANYRDDRVLGSTHMGSYAVSLKDHDPSAYLKRVGDVLNYGVPFAEGGQHTDYKRDPLR